MRTLIGFFFLLLMAEIFARRFAEPVINRQFLFGLGGSNLIALMILAIAALFLSYFFLLNKTNFWLSAVFAGVLVNLFDRLVWGGAVDYLRISFWPVFNFPDLFIVVGLLVYFIFWAISEKA